MTEFQMGRIQSLEYQIDIIAATVEDMHCREHDPQLGEALYALERARLALHSINAGRV